jgi:alkanesulfonate monooxygenase SsuD/methylene tetrahydromethanopterin reductase-like flavin-dependent oxidoreductase (luciferase family)
MDSTTSQLEFGIVDHIDKQDRPIHETFDGRLKLIAAADRAGFYAFHVTEHHFTPLGLAPSPGIFLAAASRITERLRLATLVYVLPAYNPLRLASEISMLDHLCHGRFEFGCGRGVSPWELAFYGTNHLEAPAIFKEAYEVLIAALTKDVVNYQGKYFNFYDVPIELRPVQQPHPPEWIGTTSVRGAVDAARRGISVAFNQPAERVRPLVDAYKKTWEEMHGKSGRKMPKLGMTRHIYVGDTDRQAQERGMFGFLGWYQSFAHLWRKFDPRPAAPDEHLSRAGGNLIFGSPATVRAEVERQIRESGCNYMLTRFNYGNLPGEESLRSFDLFVSEVLPHFRPAAAGRRRAAGD